jgi:hypothetical protein
MYESRREKGHAVHFEDGEEAIEGRQSSRVGILDEAD